MVVSVVSNTIITALFKAVIFLLMILYLHNIEPALDGFFYLAGLSFFLF